MSWSGLIRVLSGFLLAIALLAVGGYFATRYLIAQFTTPPPRPTFPNDKTERNVQPATKPTKPVATKPSPKTTPTPSPIPSPTPSEAVGYRARITQSNGLNLREGPSRDSNRVGGVDYNEQVTVLENSPDGEWQRVRIGSGTEGWIKSGYTDRLN